MKLINEVLKETTDQNQPLNIYISESKHDDSTPEDWVKEKTHQFEIVFEFAEVPNPYNGHSYYIDTIMNSHWRSDDGSFGLTWDTFTQTGQTLNSEKMNRVRKFIQKFVDINNLNLHKEKW